MKLLINEFCGKETKLQNQHIENQVFLVYKSVFGAIDIFGFWLLQEKLPTQLFCKDYYD